MGCFVSLLYAVIDRNSLFAFQTNPKFVKAVSLIDDSLNKEQTKVDALEKKIDFANRMKMGAFNIYRKDIMNKAKKTTLTLQQNNCRSLNESLKRMMRKIKTIKEQKALYERLINEAEDLESTTQLIEMVRDTGASVDLLNRLTTENKKVHASIKADTSAIDDRAAATAIVEENLGDDLDLTVSSNADQLNDAEIEEMMREFKHPNMASKVYPLKRTPINSALNTRNEKLNDEEKESDTQITITDEEDVVDFSRKQGYEISVSESSYSKDIHQDNGLVELQNSLRYSIDTNAFKEEDEEQGHIVVQ